MNYALFFFYEKWPKFKNVFPEGRLGEKYNPFQTATFAARFEGKPIQLSLMSPSVFKLRKFLNQLQKEWRSKLEAIGTSHTDIEFINSHLSRIKSLYLLYDYSESPPEFDHTELIAKIQNNFDCFHRTINLLSFPNKEFPFPPDPNSPEIETWV